MGEQFRILSLAIEGFRGINKRINMNFDGSSAVIFGPNGVGKSNTMQAIEWCLFGELASITVGPAEFKKEDAIVNSFHPEKKAVVEIILQGAKNKKVRVTRERKMGRSTTAGKTDFKIRFEGNEHSGDEAQLELHKLLKMTPAEFYASAYLHQEAIRDLIVGDPALRSEVIDKLLGLHFVRELIDHLPLRHVAKEAKAVEEDIEDIKKRKMQEVAISGKRLSEIGLEMVKSGIEEKELDASSLARRNQETFGMIKAIAQNMKTKIKELEKPAPDLESLEKAQVNLKRNVDELEKVWSTIYKETVGKSSNLKALKQSYEEVMRDVDSLETRDPRELLARKSEISNKISEMEKELSKMISARKLLQDESSIVHRLHTNLDGVRDELEKVKKEYGDKTHIEKSLTELQSRIDGTMGTIKTEEALGSLLVSGLDYLKSALPKSCPLCRSDIAYQNVVSILEKEISQRESARVVQKLQKELDKLKQEKFRIQEALSNLHKLQTELDGTQSEMEEEKQKLKRNGFEPMDNLMKYIDGELQRIELRISDIDEGTRKLKSEATQVDLRHEDLQKKIQKLRSIESQVQETSGISETGQSLVNKLDEHVSNSDQSTRILEGTTEDIRVSKNRLETCEKILGFLKEKERVERLEKGLPALRERLKDLEERYSKIKELETGLTDIYEATSAAREEMVKKALSEMQSAIGSYYSKILCHPYYVNLQLMPEEERGKAIYRIRAWDKDFKQGTYVQTRFSNAQMNAAALSLFLSMSMRLQSNLGLILFDDPSQSMDKVHKEALSRLLGEIMEEKQMLVATQDTEFKQYMERSVSKGKTIIYEFKKWDTQGPEIGS